MIVGGEDVGYNMLDIVEVVDNYTNCKADPFPIKLSYAVGINGTICGGESPTNFGDYRILSSCWHLNPNGTWTSGKDMLEARAWFSINKVDDEMFVIGGDESSPVCVEKYSLSKDEYLPCFEHAPAMLNDHCTVTLNTSYIFVTGGVQLGQVNSNQH